MILYKDTGRTYIFTQILSSVQPWREQSLGFLLQLKEVQHVHHGLFDVGAKTVGVLEQRKKGLKISATTTAKKKGKRSSAFHGRTYSFWTGALAGDVKIDQILAHNDVGDAVTIISHLERREEFKNSLTATKATRLKPWCKLKDYLPDQSHRRKTRTLDVWRGQTDPPAAQESDWWTASKAQTGPETH